MGDFNATVESSEMAELVTDFALLDTYAVKHPERNYRRKDAHQD